MRWLRLALVPVVAMSFACGGGDDDAATTEATSASAEAPPTTDLEDAFLEQFAELKAGQWARAYARLHPAQQALVSEEAFMACADETFGTLPADTTATVDETFDEDYTIPGVGERIPTTAVTYTISDGEEKVSDTLHLAAVEGTWRWFLASPEDCMTDV
jgi:hypothetical protein